MKKWLYTTAPIIVLIGSAVVTGCGQKANPSPSQTARGGAQSAVAQPPPPSSPALEAAKKRFAH